MEKETLKSEDLVANVLLFNATSEAVSQREERAGNGNGAMRGGARLLCVEVVAVLKTFGVAGFRGIGDQTCRMQN